jgi:hypothetical protein
MDAPSPISSIVGRHAAVALFVGFWMLCGWAADLNANAYLVLGVPLVVLFQRFVAGRPLAALWVAGADRVTLGRKAIAIAILLALAPLASLVTQRPIATDWAITWWFACAIVGAAGAAFALRKSRGAALKRALPLAWGAAMVGCATIAWFALQGGRSPLPQLSGFLVLVLQFFIYLPAMFVLEEVVFRGALDAYITRDANTSEAGLISAIYISIFWSLWHLPIAPQYQNAAGVATLLVVHVPIGILLSYTWRTSGTLLLPAVVHSLVDAYRNVILG